MEILEIRKLIRKDLMKYGRERYFGFGSERVGGDTWTYDEYSGWLHINIYGENENISVDEPIGSICSVNKSKLNRLRHKVRFYMNIWKNTNVEQEKKDKIIIIEKNKLKLQKDFV